MAVEFHELEGLGNSTIHVLALVLTVLQASSTLPGNEHDSDPFYASIFSTGPSV